MSDLSLSRKKPLLLIIDLYKTEDEYRIQTPEGLAALTRIKYLHESFFFTRNYFQLLETLCQGSIIIERDVNVCSGAREKS